MCRQGDPPRASRRGTARSKCGERSRPNSGDTWKLAEQHLSYRDKFAPKIQKDGPKASACWAAALRVQSPDHCPSFRNQTRGGSKQPWETSSVESSIRPVKSAATRWLQAPSFPNPHFLSYTLLLFLKIKNKNQYHVHTHIYFWVSISCISDGGIAERPCRRLMKWWKNNKVRVSWHLLISSTSVKPNANVVHFRASTGLT